MLTGFILALGVFTSRLIEVTPIALELLFENNPDPVIVLDTEGKVVSASPGGRNLGTMIVIRDITKSKQYEAELINLSFHDQLTGLNNRHYFMNELKRLESSREYPVAVVSADLDNLKLVNDAFDHWSCPGLVGTTRLGFQADTLSIV